jgi:mannose-1-phosphate guanylyltransferase / phosphomannomutase
MNKAVIMAGGFGTRLRPLTMSIPKPMIPVLNTPMMAHIVDLLKKHSIKDIVSVLYFHPEIITSYFEDGSDFGVNMKYVLATADYGTAGAVKNAYEVLGQDRFIVISGDVLTDFDISKAVEYHIAKKAKATILLTRVSTPLQYGIVMTDEEGKITRFLEKPSWGQVFSDTINTGIYILEPEVLDLIPYQEDFDFSKDLFPAMLRQNMPLYGYITEGYWRDIGNLNEYQQGQIDALNNNVVLNVKGVVKDRLVIGTKTKVPPTVKISGNVIIGNNSIIGEYSELHNCVIGDNVTIGSGVKLTNVTLWNNIKIDDFVEATDDVICNNCHIGRSATISENVFIAEDCFIGANARLMPNIKLWPDKQVEVGATLSTSLVQESKLSRELFTDARVSGLSNIDINPEFGAKLGASVGMAFGHNTTLIASRDPDKVSRVMKRTVAAGLASVGVNVDDLQVTSIPQTRQDLRIGKYAGGFHIRKSPRNPEETEIIIFNKEGRDIPISRTKSVERYFFGEDIKRVKYSEVGNINYPERANEIYVNRFIQALNTDIIKKRKFKLLMDYSYGLASSIFPYILGKLNTEALSLHDFVDASRYRPSFIPGAVTEDDEVEKIMRSLGYELGFRMEPGAEKISLIDERGVWYPPMRLLSIVTKLFLETNKNRVPYKIAVSVVATKEIEQIAKDYNVEVERIQNSHSAMMEATRDESILFVGGIWGGYIFSDFLFASDGMYTVGKILEMLSETGMKISDIDSTLPRRFQSIVDVQVPWEYKGTVMRKAMEYSDKMKRQLIEGVKIHFDNEDSVLFLPNKEKPTFAIISESNDFETAEKLSVKYSSMVTNWKEEEE